MGKRIQICDDVLCYDAANCGGGHSGAMGGCEKQKIFEVKKGFYGGAERKDG